MSRDFVFRRSWGERLSTGVFTGYTYSGHAVSCAAGLGVMRLLKAERSVDEIAAAGNYLLAAAKDKLKQPIVGEVGKTC
ncbi:hypothetical protein ACFPL7_15855 [Dongia soli]|uniref:Uncharacterized protein n=1 Tax=Dongia soli TaxID=600628 RepID=A0ABU5ECT9_9PROT|nr:hypothetical protein [Dongia soli]MDY0883629.1 hypothetical protein [Dongia soli]